MHRQGGSDFPFLPKRKITRHIQAFHSSECVCVYIYASCSHGQLKLGLKLQVCPNQVFISICTEKLPPYVFSVIQ